MLKPKYCTTTLWSRWMACAGTRSATKSTSHVPSCPAMGLLPGLVSVAAVHRARWAAPCPVPCVSASPIALWLTPSQDTMNPSHQRRLLSHHLATTLYPPKEVVLSMSLARTRQPPRPQLSPWGLHSEDWWPQPAARSDMTRALRAVMMRHRVLAVVPLATLRCKRALAAPQRAQASLHRVSCPMPASNIERAAVCGVRLPHRQHVQSSQVPACWLLTTRR